MGDTDLELLHEAVWGPSSSLSMLSLTQKHHAAITGHYSVMTRLKLVALEYKLPLLTSHPLIK